MRPLADLLASDDAIGLVRGLSTTAPHPVEVLPAGRDAGARALEALQVSTRSHLGAIAFHTGGLLVDGGWLRILGAGHPRLPRSVDGWNGPHPHRCAHGLLIADDVLGGFFAWFAAPRTVHYLAPDSLAWEDLDLGYGAWLNAMCTERFAVFYMTFRWPGWEREVSELTPEQGLSVYPPLWAAHDGPRSRRAVPIDELWRLHVDG